MTQKWNLQDIRPTNPRPPRRTNQEHPQEPQMRRPQPGQRPENHSEANNSDVDKEFSTLPSIEVVNGKKRKRGLLIVSIIVVIMFVIGSIFISVFTGGATITVNPKHRTVTVNAEFTAYKEKVAGELTYEVLTLETSGERQVEASGQEEVTAEASGMIEIKKTTPGAERLINNTRFVSPDGKVFRITEAVVVPGAVANSAGVMQPGTIQVEVVASDVGDEYNLPAGTKFTVPGFQESNLTELYNSITATNPTAFSGGYNGPRFIIEEEKLSEARQLLQVQLRDTLLAKVNDELPVEFITFDSAVAITYTQQPTVQYDDNLVTLREQAILQIPLFRASDFASFVAKESIVGYNLSEPVRIKDIDEIRFSYVSATTSQSIIANNDSLDFKLVGNPHIVWTYDAEDITNELVGKDRTAHIQVLGKYPGIMRSTIDIKPFWSRTFPNTPNKIKVVEVLTDQQ